MLPRKEFYFVRHGQTDFNLSLIKINHPDVPLNPTGIGQAHAIEPLIRALPIKSVCHSPFKRAKETKEIITSNLQADFHVEIPLLGECTCEEWASMTLYGFQPYDAHPRDGIGFLFMKNVFEGVSEALARPGPVLIVAHGGVHFAICSMMNIQNHEWCIDNCLPVHFIPEGDKEWRAKKLL